METLRLHGDTGLVANQVCPLWKLKNPEGHRLSAPSVWRLLAVAPGY